MIEEQDKIVLGGVDYTATALTFAQLQVVLPAIAAAGGKDTSLTDRMKHAGTAIAPAIGKTDEEFARIRMTVAEVLKALKVVARISGLTELGEMAAAAPGATA